MTQTLFQVGDQASFSKMVTEADIQMFAQVSGDHNPIHLDEAYARTTTFEKRIAHGMLSAGFISAALAHKLPGPGAIYLSQSLKFKAPVFPGDTITVTVTIKQYREEKGILTLETNCSNQSGQEVIAGEAVVMLSKK